MAVNSSVFRFISIILISIFTLLCFSSCSVREEIDTDDYLNGDSLHSLGDLIVDTVEDITFELPVTETVPATEKITVYVPETQATTKKSSDNNYDSNIVAQDVQTEKPQETTTAPQLEEEKNQLEVYVTPSGKRYHYSSTCGGKNSYAVSIDNVGDRTPCKKCGQ